MSIAGDVLGGPELQGDPPLLGQGVQGGQQGVLHQLQLPRVGEGALEGAWEGKKVNKQ